MNRVRQAGRSGRHRYGAGLRQLQGMGPERFVLSGDHMIEFRSCHDANEFVKFRFCSSNLTNFFTKK